MAILMCDCVVLRRKGKRAEIYPFGSLGGSMPTEFKALRFYNKRIEQRDWTHTGKESAQRFGYYGTFEDE